MCSFFQSQDSAEGQDLTNFSEVGRARALLSVFHNYKFKKGPYSTIDAKHKQYYQLVYDRPGVAVEKVAKSLSQKASVYNFTASQEIFS